MSESPTRVRLSASAASGTTLASGRYFACLAILVVAGATNDLIADALKVYFSKQAIPLLKPLYLFDISRLGADYESHTQQPPPLSHEMEENLGATDYWQCNFVDRRPDHAETRVIRLFVTYNTGTPDMVPHNPRECNAASGFVLMDDTNITVEIPYKEKTVEIPVSVLRFAPPQNDARVETASPMTVLYFFYANGRYETSRLGVRNAVHRLRDRYAYYSKIELSFLTERGAWASQEASVEAAREFLGKLMPGLWDDHYQDWGAIQAGAAPKAGNQAPAE